MIIPATVVCEESITIPWVRVVINSRKSMTPRFETVANSWVLHEARATWQSNEQRKGRAGRMCPGYYYTQRKSPLVYTEQNTRTRTILIPSHGHFRWVSIGRNCMTPVRPSSTGEPWTRCVECNSWMMKARPQRNSIPALPIRKASGWAISPNNLPTLSSRGCQSPLISPCNVTSKASCLESMIL